MLWSPAAAVAEPLWAAQRGADRVAGPLSVPAVPTLAAIAHLPRRSPLGLAAAWRAPWVAAVARPSLLDAVTSSRVLRAPRKGVNFGFFSTGTSLLRLI